MNVWVLEDSTYKIEKVECWQIRRQNTYFKLEFLDIFSYWTIVKRRESFSENLLHVQFLRWENSAVRLRWRTHKFSCRPLNTEFIALAGMCGVCSDCKIKKISSNQLQMYVVCRVKMVSTSMINNAHLGYSSIARISKCRLLLLLLITGS